VFFNKAMPLEVLHMLVAAYLVAGFLIASVYAVAMLRGRRDRYHRLGFLIPFTIAAIAAPVQMVVGDQLARWVYNNEPTKFAAIEMVPRTARDVPETLFGHLTESGEVKGGIPLPGVASILSDPSTGTRTQIRGLAAFPKNARPTNHEVDVVHWAWDVMVGIGSGLFLLSAWFAVVWWRRRDIPRTPWFLRAAAVAGVASIAALESGWIVTEVGRQPWIARGFMRVSQAATGNEGVWVTFLVIVALYLGVAVTLILVLRQMAHRFRENDPHAEQLLPYTPRARRRASVDRSAP
jgi:cytochrome d ubiquinol oxidase subunit I